MQLPGFIPIFPLPDVVLFPEVPLPLHIFEPRYCAMVRDAIAGSGLIGMVLLRGAWQEEYDGAPETYRTGCVGRIVETTPLPEGKFNIVLAGIREFTIVSEQRERAYRQATVSWREPDPVTPLPSTLRGRLVRMIERYVERSGDDVARELLGDSRLDDRTLVNFFAFWLDIGALEKQCLLEAAGVERTQRLLEVLEFHVYAGPTVPNDAAARRMH
ncbi:MAG: LON peptidase substrate-binding domain-containing protein [Deltaproteobacteria bacterium]|nr:LON peptidase substrate-binding domain-containing protein [Deltaproteobacteria bacterium]